MIQFLLIAKRAKSPAGSSARPPFASSREPTLPFLTRRREEGLPLRQCFALPPPPASCGRISCGRIIVVSAEPKILPELVSGRWQPEGLTEGNVV